MNERVRCDKCEDNVNGDCDRREARVYLAYNKLLPNMLPRVQRGRFECVQGAATRLPVLNLLEPATPDRCMGIGSYLACDQSSLEECERCGTES